MLETEYKKAIERTNSSKRKNSKKKRRSRDSAGDDYDDDIYGIEDGESDEDGENEEEEEEEEEIDEEEVLRNIQHCKELIDGVKKQTWKMSKKLQVQRNARAYVEAYEGKLSRSKGYQQRGREIMKRWKRSWNNFAASLVPWEMKIKRIESHFGSVVASYFIFLRWLLWISVWLAVIHACFIIIPEMLVGSSAGSGTRKEVPEGSKDTEADLETMWNAEGIVQYSPIFYGYYGNVNKIGQGYRLPLAYLVTSLAAFAFSFIVVLKRMAANSRQSRVSETSDEEYVFAWKLFTEWDYMIESEETANTKHASITTTFKESIIEEQEKAKEENKYLQLTLRILANVIIVICLATSTFIIQLFVERSREMEIEKRNNPEFEPGFWDSNELTVIMTLISTLFPNVLDLISLMEKYHPRTSLRLMLARIFVLNLLNLYTLFIALYNKQNDLRDSLEALSTNMTLSTQNCTSVLTNMTTSDLDDTTLTQSISSYNSSDDLANVTTCEDILHIEKETAASLCWETMIGQEVFKLTVTDMVFVVGQILIIDVLRTYFIKYANNLCCWDMEKTFPEYPDFKTAENLLHLISNQGTIWLGSFFAPGLPLLNLAKLLMLVYIRCWVVLVYNAPQERIFRASRSNNFYFALLLIMLFLCMLPPLFAIVAIEPSPFCGPFSGRDKVYHVLTQTMRDELPESVSSIIEYAASPGVIMPIFMLLGMAIYYLVSVGRSLREVNNDLKNQLEYERTEGRKKVYAMADARHAAAANKPKGWGAAKNRFLQGKGQRGVANTANTILDALRASKTVTGSERPKPPPPVAPRKGQTRSRTTAGLHSEKDNDDDGRRGVKNEEGEKSRKMLSILEKLQESQRKQAGVPVAIIEGKQSVKAAKDREIGESKAAFRKALLSYAKTEKYKTHEELDDSNEKRSQVHLPSRDSGNTKSRQPKHLRNKNVIQDQQPKSLVQPKSETDSNSEIEADIITSSKSREVRSQSGTRSHANRDSDTHFENRSAKRTTAEIHNSRNVLKDRKLGDGSRYNKQARGKSSRSKAEVRFRNDNSGLASDTNDTIGPRTGRYSSNRHNLARRVSSSSMVDENGHLKLCGSDNSSDEEEEDNDDSDDDHRKRYEDDDDVGDDDDDSENDHQIERGSNKNNKQARGRYNRGSIGADDTTRKTNVKKDGQHGISKNDSDEQDTSFHVNTSSGRNHEEGIKVNDRGINKRVKAPRNYKNKTKPILTNAKSNSNGSKSERINPHTKTGNSTNKGPILPAEFEIINEATTSLKSTGVVNGKSEKEDQQDNEQSIQNSRSVKIKNVKKTEQPIKSTKQNSKNATKSKDDYPENDDGRYEGQGHDKLTRSQSESSYGSPVPTITVEDYSGTLSSSHASIPTSQQHDASSKRVKGLVKGTTPSEEQSDATTSTIPTKVRVKDLIGNIEHRKTGASPTNTNAIGNNNHAGSRNRSEHDVNDISSHGSESGTINIEDINSKENMLTNSSDEVDEKIGVGYKTENGVKLVPNVSGRNKEEVHESGTANNDGNASSQSSKAGDLRNKDSKNNETNTQHHDQHDNKSKTSKSIFGIFKATKRKHPKKSKNSKSTSNQEQDRIIQDDGGFTPEQSSSLEREVSSDNHTGGNFKHVSSTEPTTSVIFNYDIDSLMNPSPQSPNNTSPDSLVNLGMFRRDRPSLANIHMVDEHSSANVEPLTRTISHSSLHTTTISPPQEQPPKNHRTELPRVDLDTSHIPRQSDISTSIPPESERRTNKSRGSKQFTVLAITNGNLQIEASDDEILQY